MTHDHRRASPAALRNREAILNFLQPVLPKVGTVLEVASGSGEHVVHFATALPGLIWQPSDPSPQARDSITAWTRAGHLQNILPPLDLDTMAAAWPIDHADAVIAINMVHISPWKATLGLLQHSAKILPSGGLLFLYGPYRRRGLALEPSNALFDADLRNRNPAWGVRHLDDVVQHAELAGFRLDDVVGMPANNLSVILKRN